MTQHFRAGAIVVGIFLCGGYASISAAVGAAFQKDAMVTNHASGTFDVKITPQDDKGEDASLGRMAIDKQFHGDLEATSHGQMLTAGTGAKGSSGGYVAIEKVSGTLHGRSGTFVLQHSGTMTRGTPKLSLTVVPDSGTGQLVGLAGAMSIKIADGKHSYEFDYTLAEAH
jgi:Protein of unknown function (DUF3224)